MVTRFIGLLLGLALAAYGYDAMNPASFVAPYVPAVDLGPFAGQAGLISQIALAFGLVLAVAAVLPRNLGRKAPKAKPAVEFHDEPEPTEHYAAPKMGGGSAQPSPLW
jgi:hypothetical protein